MTTAMLYILLGVAVVLISLIFMGAIIGGMPVQMWGACDDFKPTGPEEDGYPGCWYCGERKEDH